MRYPFELRTRGNRVQLSATVQVIVFTPQPRLVKLQLAPHAIDQLMIGERPVTATRYLIKPQLGVLASLEQAAGRLCAFEATTVHGLLQTADYALAVERADAVPKSEDGIVRRVDLGQSAASASSWLR